MNILEVLERGMSTYCEGGIGLLSTQPLNMISNLAFFVSAYFAYRCIRIHSVKNRTIVLLQFILVVIGVGSILWHGMPNLLTSFADTLPISAFVLVSFFFLLDKILPHRNLVWGMLSGFILIEAPFILGVLPSLNGFIPYLIALLFGLSTLFGFRKQYKLLFPKFVLIAVLFIIAFFFRTIDHAICSPFPTGTHFIWHILSAAVFYELIRFFIEVEKRKGRC